MCRNRLQEKRVRRFALTVGITQAFFLYVLSNSQAQNLTDVLERGFTLSFPTFQVDTGSLASNLAPAFSDAVSQAVTRQFPLASVAPAYVYRYNAALSVFERVTSVPGPLFSERALTVGQGQLNFGVGYSYISFDDIDGTALDSVANTALIPDPSVEEAAPFLFRQPGGGLAVVRGGLAPFVLSRLRTRIELQSHVVVPTVRYGIRDSWDVSFSIPVVNTSLRVREESVPVAVVDPDENVGYLYRAPRFGGLEDPGREDGLRRIAPGLPGVKVKALSFIRAQYKTRKLSKAAGSATGIGDISLRGKYQFWKLDAGGAALGLNLQLPTGEEKDFLGTGDTRLGSFVYFSQVFQERFEPHLNLGIDFNANDVDRSSFRYAVRASMLIWRQLGFTLDIFGLCDFARPVPPGTNESLSGVQGIVLDKAAKKCTDGQPCRVTSDQAPVFVFPETFKRSNIIDLSFAFRYMLGDAGSLFFAGIVPLNNDGFRADFIPSAGIEYTF